MMTQSIDTVRGEGGKSTLGTRQWRQFVVGSMSEATRGDKVGDKCTSVPDAMISNAQNLAQVKANKYVSESLLSTSPTERKCECPHELVSMMNSCPHLFHPYLLCPRFFNPRIPFSIETSDEWSNSIYLHFRMIENFLRKEDVAALLSHQIPARKLPEDQSGDGVRESWVLDLASVPPDLVSATLVET
ncbi:hypothetical protein HID58_037706 [Brassica napus]|uniref:Uncharacterized protein n=1 Tax=Brassica napus TaxID=3708 RepID=A0ABQ8BM89_BRANA|nr:hypothetical protein HID58_037706 [Brassica napus]